MAIAFFNFASFLSHRSHRLYPQTAESPRAAAGGGDNNNPYPSPKKITTKEVLTDLSPLIKVYTDGTVERPLKTPDVPPSPEDSTTGVASKDITISPLISARIYLPKLTHPTQKLPIVVYFRGGYFCIGSTFSLLEYRYTNLLTAACGALVVSVDFRLAPEHPLPAAYDDSWYALNWICSHGIEKDEWIANHADFNRLFLCGDSSGANIAHNLVMRTGSDPLPGPVKIAGAIVSQPYFWGSKPIGNEPEVNREGNLLHRMWLFVHPTAGGGIDDPLINPFADGAPSLSGLGCGKIMVCVAEKDATAARGRLYAEKVRKSGWRGEVEVVEVEGEDHCFHVYFPEKVKARNLINRMAAFISH
ncbi:hypothetical protein ACS0TY_022676 [Phlomoides rotata]